MQGRVSVLRLWRLGSGRRGLIPSAKKGKSQKDNINNIDHLHICCGTGTGKKTRKRHRTTDPGEDIGTTRALRRWGFEGVG